DCSLGFFANPSQVKKRSSNRKQATSHLQLIYKVQIAPTMLEMVFLCACSGHHSSSNFTPIKYGR
ncbi:MAG: hypothetical protein Q9N62_13050, partial [Ghiorsea sp.]|nr:hypothetical protein [Ghiorsea sp.]